MKFRPFPINISPPTHCPVKRINKTNNKEKTIYISRQLTISRLSQDYLKKIGEKSGTEHLF